LPGDIVRERISGTNFIIDVARAGSPNTFIPLNTFPNVPATSYKFALNIAFGSRPITANAYLGLV
jgi:hypothetical protein